MASRVKRQSNWYIYHLINTGFTSSGKRLAFISTLNRTKTLELAQDKEVKAVTALITKRPQLDERQKGVRLSQGGGDDRPVEDLLLQCQAENARNQNSRGTRWCLICLGLRKKTKKLLPFRMYVWRNYWYMSSKHPWSFIIKKHLAHTLNLIIGTFHLEFRDLPQL